MARPKGSVTRRAVVSSKERILGCRLTSNEMDQAEDSARDAKLTLSKWARRVLVRELTGESRDPLGTYLRDQWKWSKRTFGDGRRTNGILAHIRKELAEIEENPTDLVEWLDVAILAMDGFWRHGGKPEQLFPMLLEKQKVNFARQWPTPLPEDMPTEHIKIPETPVGYAANREWPIESELADIIKAQYERTIRANDRGEVLLLDTVAAEEFGTKLLDSIRPEVIAAKHSWVTEWDAMEQMEPSEASARFAELKAGRALPIGFKGWGKAERVKWLDREWPL